MSVHGTADSTRPGSARRRTPAAAGVGVAAPFRLVSSLFVASLVCFLLSAVAFVGAADDLGAGAIAAPPVLLAVHLLTLGFLPFAIAGAAFHVLPVFLRVSPHPVRAWTIPLCLCSGPFLAVGIAHHRSTLVWPAVAVFSVGILFLLLEVGTLILRAPRGKLLLVSRFGVAAALCNGLLSFLTGAVLFSVQWRPWAGIPHERLIAIHLHLALLGCLTLLIVTVGRTLGPMLALAPVAPRRRLPTEEILLTAGLWVAIVGLAADNRTVVVIGTGLALAAVLRFVGLLVRVARERRTASVEAPLGHFLVGLLFLGQGVVVLAFLFQGHLAQAELSAYVLFLLLGWAAGVTLGHVGRLLALSAWTWWPPGPRPKQAAFFDQRAWTLEVVSFAAAVELMAVGALLESVVVTRVGAVLLVLAALLGLGGALRTTWTPVERQPER